MDKKTSSFIERNTFKNFSFGKKLRFVVVLLVLGSLALNMVVGLFFFKQFIKDTNNKSLELLNNLKRNEVEDFYSSSLRKISEIPDLISSYTIEELSNGFDNYTSDISKNDSLTYIKEALKAYYQLEVIDKINYNRPSLESIQSIHEHTIFLQYHYLVKNHHQSKEKYRLNKSYDGSQYSRIHEQIHGKFNSIVKSKGYNNIYIIDSKKGNIIYTYNKNIAFGNNIFSSYLKNTPLSTVFQRALIADKGNIAVSDLNFFIPNMNRPVAFFATPLDYNGRKNAVLVVELGPDFFSSVLFNNGSDNEITFNIIGEDKKLRNIPIEEINNDNNFNRRLKKLPETGKQALDIGTSALSLAFDDKLFKANGNIGNKTNHLGEKAFITVDKLNIRGLNWYLVTQKPEHLSLVSLKKIAIIMIIVLVFLVAISIIVTNNFKKLPLKDIIKVNKAIQNLVEGKRQEKLTPRSNDEIGVTLKTFNQLNTRIENAEIFALSLSEEKYNAEFNATSENDQFALALNTLKKSLQINKEAADKRNKEDQIRNWTNEGIAKFNDLLRQSNDNINNLAYIIIENLIDYIKANIGGVFLVEGEQDSEKAIHLIASYAYDRRKYEQKTIEIGEGIIGNCYLEKKPVLLKSIPQDYLEIGTGMGKASPKVVYISPLIYDDEVLGFVELASFEEFKAHEIDFVEKLSENIAATFSTVKLNTKTAILLEESKRRANEIAQQEEEMRQNLEEMQATQEELARLRNEDEKSTNKLKNEIESSNAMIQEIVNNMSGEVYIKDPNGVIVLANEELAARFNSTPQKLIGKSDSTLFSPERFKKEEELDKQVLTNGLLSDEINETIGSEIQTYFIVKKPFYFSTTKETGVITIRNKR